MTSLDQQRLPSDNGSQEQEQEHRQGAGRPPSAGPPPEESVQLLSLLTAPWISQSLYVMAKFDIADLIADGTCAVDELADKTALHPEALFRMMRALAGARVFREVAPRCFQLGDLGHYLRSDVPGTQKYSALLFGEETFQAWSHVLHTARTGAPAFDEVFDQPFYAYLQDHADKADVFNRVMGSSGVVPPVLNGFDFGTRRHVVDIGGGTGQLLADVLARHGHLRGTLFDLPSAVDESASALDLAGVTDRCERVAGDFFGAIPQGADTYLLSRVLHNWDDDDAVRILRGVRRAIAPDGVLLICERLLPPGDAPHIGKVFDLVMLVMLGGRDRTADEYRRLLQAAGFELGDTTSGPAGVGLITARPTSPGAADQPRDGAERQGAQASGDS